MFFINTRVPLTQELLCSCARRTPSGMGAAGGDSPPVPCSVPSQRGNGDWGSQRPAAAPCCVLGSQTGILARADSTAHHVFGCIEGKSSTSLEAEHCCPCSPRGLEVKHCIWHFRAQLLQQYLPP